MKNGPLLFLGLFSAIGLSWAGVVLGSHGQLGSLTPYFDETEGKSFPERIPGNGARGQLVYRDLGCAACHTQQVRRPDFGSDQARGWGERQSFARDYIYQPAPQLGEMRIGPDLANLGNAKRAYDRESLLNLLYTGSGQMPSYKFLFVEREIVGQRSAKALNLVGKLAPAAGHEVVPTNRAEDLASYLLALNNTYDYPPETATNTVKAEPKEGGHK